MKSEDESIQALTRAVQSRAKEDAEQVLADAQAKADSFQQRGREESAAERRKILAQAEQDAQRIRSQAVATTQMKARTLKLASREKLLDRAFEAARKQLASIPQRPDYDRVLRRMLREALAHLETDAVRIQADDRTRQLLTDPWLADMSKETGVRLQLGPGLKQGMGIVVETADGHRQFDNTLETRMRRMRDRLRTPVYKLLEGESQ
jgi:vacuolar-type H+-ATPase subunit E/Vma4